MSTADQPSGGTSQPAGSNNSRPAHPGQPAGSTGQPADGVNQATDGVNQATDRAAEPASGTGQSAGATAVGSPQPASATAAGASPATDSAQKRGRAARLAQKADQWQQRHRVTAIAVATWKKFGDDQAGNLAALIAYYAFISFFPLLLVLVTVLDLVVRNNAKLREQLLNSALHQYPVIGPQLESHVHGLTSTGVALGVAILVILYGARGVANAIQNAMNTAWNVPRYRRPGFPWSLLRSFGLIAVLGPGLIVTITLSSVAGGTGHLSGWLAPAAAAAVSLVLNVGLFWLAFRIATAKEVPFRDLRLSAILAAIVWQLLQLLGGYFIGHQLKSNSAFGAFAVVLGLIAWFYLQAELTLYLTELNIVRSRRLWPRSLTPPPLTDADMQAYELYAQATKRRPDVEIEVKQEHAAAGRSRHRKRPQ
jgi:membrane protein